MIGVLVTVAVLVAVASLRLMSRPISLDFLKPRIAQAIDTAGGKLRVDAEHISLEWSGLAQPVRLVFHGIHVTDMDKKELATAPSVAFSFAPRSIFEGHLFPTAIMVDQPTLNADIDREGGMLQRVLAKTDSNSQGEVVALLIEQLLAEPNHHSLLGQLDTVLVERAHVTLRDVPSGVVWAAPSAHVSLKRDSAGVIISAQARFSRGTGGEPIDVSLSGTYARDRSRISIEAGIDGVKPLMFADFSPDAAILSGIDIALSGRMKIDADGSGNIRAVRAEVTGGRGTIALPGILAATQTVRSVNAVAVVDADSHTAKIEHINIDLGAAKVSITGLGTKTDKGQSFTGRADLKQVPVDRLADYWPITLAPGGRDWALANVSLGSLDVGVEFALSAPGDDLSKLSVDRAAALLAYRGLKIHYMPHMPEVEGVSGTARFENDAMHFDVAGGMAVGLGVTGATIDLTNLNGLPAEQIASLHVPIAGPTAMVMAMLSRPKLALPRDALFDPKRIQGATAVTLDLRFPLLNDLSVKDIDIRAVASLSGLQIKNLLPDLDLTEGVGRIVYADDQLTVNGQARIDGTPIDISIRELFAPKAPFRQRYELKGTLPATLMTKAGLPSPEPYVTGPVGTALVYQTLANGTGEVTGKFDLKGAKLDVASFGWAKAAGVEALLNLTVKLSAAGKVLSADFDGRGGGLTTKGLIGFVDGGTVQQVNFQQLSLGRSDLALEWKRNATGVEMVVRGRSLELSRVREGLKARADIAAKQPGGAAAKAEGDTKLTVNLEQVVLKRGTLGALNGRLEMKGDVLASADVSLGAGKGMAFKVTPAPPRGRNVAVFIPDFGLLLKEAGWLEGLVGGDLSFQGGFDDSTPEPKLTGKIKLGPYRMTKVDPNPDVGSLNSTIDGLNRAGNALQQFDVLEGNITKVGDRIDIANGRTSGKSIGLTTAGWIDLGKDLGRLRGIVVPGFALNNLLSNVPLLGPLLTGGKDGGLFAFTYKLEGPLDDLKSDVNVMSAMTPGALRELFTAPVTQDPVSAQDNRPTP